MFKYVNGQLVNEKGKIVEVQGPIKDADQNNRYIKLTTDKKQSLTRLWRIVYVKDMPKELKKGQMDRDFGFRVNKDFHIVSKMGEHRYVDLISNNVVLKTPNGFKSQVWFFDNNTKTIKSRRTTSYSLQIASSGTGNKALITSTNSRWW
jgi:hypothetical protein